MNERLPPMNLEAERAVLASILRYPDAMLTLRATLDVRQFYADCNQRIYATLCGLFDTARPIDLVTVAAELERLGHTADTGGPAALAELYTSEQIGAAFEYHASLVRDAATRRAIIHAANETLADAYANAAPAADLLAEAERRFLAIGEQATNLDTAAPASTFLPRALERIDERVSNGGKLLGLATNYNALDDLFAGLRPGEQIVVAARPSVGKTAFALNVLVNVARIEAAPVLFFSLEMPLADIADRLLAMTSGVSLQHFTKAPKLTNDEVERLSLAGSHDGAAAMPLWVDDTPDATAARIAAVSRRMVRRYGVKLIAIDYLGLMRPANPTAKRHEQVGDCAKATKYLARELGVPVMLLAQLNRELEGRGDNRPRLSDLRDSGEIEQHADRVLFLHRTADQPGHLELWRTELTVGKNRNGPTGELALDYRRPIMRFENASPNW